MFKKLVKGFYCFLLFLFLVVVVLPLSLIITVFRLANEGSTNIIEKIDRFSKWLHEDDDE